MQIREITNIDIVLQETINEFIFQLTGNTGKMSSKQIEEIILDNNSHLFFATDDQGNYMGMITVGLYLSPTGKKSWIEDVVVDDAHRGKGIGKGLMEFAIQFAREQKAALLTLTSRPARISANKLYQKLGFQQKETNVYTMQLQN